MAARAPSQTIRWRNGEFAGTFSISGTVAIDDSPDVPVMRRVRLYDRYSGGLVRETWSDPVTGAYSFLQLPNDRTFFVLSHDHTDFYNATIKDNITPE
jgi:hypothetical protein